MIHSHSGSFLCVYMALIGGILLFYERKRCYERQWHRHICRHNVIAHALKPFCYAWVKEEKL